MSPKRRAAPPEFRQGLPITEDRISRRDLLRWAGIAGVGGIGMGLIGCSDPPEQEISEGTTPPTTIKSGSTVNGTVTGLLTGAAVSGAVLEILGMGEVTADFAGNFTINFDQAGDYSARISAPNFVTRETRMRISANDVVPITLIETDESLTENFLNQWARGQGPILDGLAPRTPGMTNRWESAPDLRIYRRLAGDPDTVLSDDRIDQIIAAATGSYAQFTAGSLGFLRNIEQVDSAPPADNGQMPLGTIGFYQTADGSRGGGTTGAVSDAYAAASGYAFSGTDASTRVLTRVFGQSLGATPVEDALTSVMNTEGSREFTEEDDHAAAVLYGRPPGSQAPDKDPARFFVNV